MLVLTTLISSPSMLEEYIYSEPSTVEGIMFDPDTSGNVRKRSSEMYEGVEKLGNIIHGGSAKKGSGGKL
tara:strand:+ start:412 stop:621 length:210 start_codon:yes stop_codon:yes gene_type:complete